MRPAVVRRAAHKARAEVCWARVSRGRASREHWARAAALLLAFLFSLAAGCGSIDHESMGGGCESEAHDVFERVHMDREDALDCAHDVIADSSCHLSAPLDGRAWADCYERATSAETCRVLAGVVLDCEGAR